MQSAVLAATLAALVERGYAFAVDEVAAAAGVHKTSVYRRWPTKALLVAAAVEQLAAVEVGSPRTGDPLDDLHVLAAGVARALRSGGGGQVLRAVVAAAAEDPGLVVTVRTFLAGRYDVAVERVVAAREGGLLRADVDAVLLWRAVVNPLHVAAICGEPLGDAATAALLELVLDGARPRDRRRAGTGCGLPSDTVTRQ